MVTMAPEDEKPEDEAQALVSKCMALGIRDWVVDLAADPLNAHGFLLARDDLCFEDDRLILEQWEDELQAFLEDPTTLEEQDVELDFGFVACFFPTDSSATQPRKTSGALKRKDGRNQSNRSEFSYDKGDGVASSKRLDGNAAAVEQALAMGAMLESLADKSPGLDNGSPADTRLGGRTTEVRRAGSRQCSVDDEAARELHALRQELIKTFHLKPARFVLLCLQPSVARGDRKLLEAVLAVLPEGPDDLIAALRREKLLRRLRVGTPELALCREESKSAAQDSVTAADAAFARFMWQVVKECDQDPGNFDCVIDMDVFFSRSYDRIVAEMFRCAFDSDFRRYRGIMKAYEVMASEILFSERFRKVLVIMISLARYVEKDNTISSFQLDILPTLKHTLHPDGKFPSLLHTLVNGLLKKCPEVFPIAEDMPRLCNELATTIHLDELDAALVDFRDSTNVVVDVLRNANNPTRIEQYLRETHEGEVEQPYEHELSDAIEDLEMDDKLEMLISEHGELRMKLGDMLEQIGEPNIASRQRQYEILSFVRELVLDADGLWRDIYKKAMKQSLHDTGVL
ncbi:hypothetical protein FVE85_5434 [Porphyridium purpureum]|uniref:Uncharacterized protein n=1 Tax=Porphyridium purpureum TaxID=35688 RepID=A0A5J4Z1R8_PORPP|nr:hypothetical protein FVE85_5434 [Porphyridium purpureum]|eukprot:POR1467..scf295_1